MTQPAMSEQINELAAALVAAQGEFESVAKDSKNPFFKSTYAALPEVVKTASPILLKHGLAVSQHISHSTMLNNEGQDLLTTWLIHKSGQYINDTMALKLSKQDAQGQGSAITYARRYAYMSVLGLVADEDDDGNKAVAKTPSAAPKQPWRNPRPVVQTVPVPDPFMPEDLPPSPAHLQPVNAERIHAETATKLGGSLKLKGITDRQMTIDILNAIATSEHDVKGFMDMDEVDAQALLRRLALPSTKQEDLLALVNPFIEE